MFFDFIEKTQCGHYIRERAKNTLVLYQTFADPTSPSPDEDALRYLLAASFEILKGMDFIDEIHEDSDDYVERLLSDAKILCQRHNKPFSLQAVAIHMIGGEVAFMCAEKKWFNATTLGRIVVKNVSCIIPD